MGSHTARGYFLLFSFGRIRVVRDNSAWFFPFLFSWSQTILTLLLRWRWPRWPINMGDGHGQSRIVGHFFLYGQSLCAPIFNNTTRTLSASLVTVDFCSSPLYIYKFYFKILYWKFIFKLVSCILFLHFGSAHANDRWATTENPRQTFPFPSLMRR
jgi:hypothetical protein